MHVNLAPLAPLVGTWITEGVTRDSVLGPGVPTRSTETFSWFDGGHFLVSTYETVFGDEPAQKGVNYWFHDRGFRIIFFSNNGPFTEDGNRYEGQIAGDTLTFQGPARFAYALGEDGGIRMNADGSIDVEWWLRGEDGEWAPWMHNRFVRA